MTLVPIQTSLLDISMLTDKEVYIYISYIMFFILFKYFIFSLMFHLIFQIEYLNNYHAKCLKILKPLLQGTENIQALEWLERQTLPISR